MVVASSWQGAELGSSLWGDGPIAVFRAQGDFRPEAAKPMLQHAQQCVSGWGSAGLVADYSRSRMAVTADGMAAGIRSVIGERGALALPTALVVRPDDMAMWRHYTRILAEAGIVRGLFLDYDAALRWTAAQAQVFSLDDLHRIHRRIQAAE